LVLLDRDSPIIEQAACSRHDWSTVLVTGR